MAKKGQIFKKYSPEFKISIILDMRNNHMGYVETMQKRISDVTDRSGAIIKWWERKYLEESIEGLARDKRGRPIVNGKKRGCPPKLKKPVEEDLIAEN